MKTAKDIIGLVKEFFGIKPKTKNDAIQAEIAKQKRKVNIEESAGHLYIVYTDLNYEKHAFIELDPTLTVENAITMLESARRAAVNYNIL